MPNQRKNLGRSLEHKVVEEAKARGLKARRQPLSGILADFPNDAEVGDRLVEAKVRAAKLDSKGARFIRIDLDWLTGVIENARKNGYRQGIVVVRPKGSQQLLVLTELDDYLGLLSVEKGLTNQAG